MASTDEIIEVLGLELHKDDVELALIKVYGRGGDDALAHRKYNAVIAIEEALTAMTDIRKEIADGL